MGLFKKKVNTDLIVSLSNYKKADYEKSSPELQTLFNWITKIHENVEDVFKKSLSSILSITGVDTQDIFHMNKLAGMTNTVDNELRLS